jgi:hypothetical protein
VAGELNVASFVDLLQHMEGTLTQDERLHAECVYRGTPLPAWLAQPLRDTQAHADGRAGVLVLNVKGRRTPDTLCLLRLSDLERLLGHAAGETAP